MQHEALKNRGGEGSRAVTARRAAPAPSRAAGSLVALYAVLGTLALGLAATPAHARRYSSQQPEASPSAPKAGAGVRQIQPVNLRPLKDVLRKGWGMLERGEIALSGPTEITLEADRDRQGHFRHFEVSYPAALGEGMLALSTEVASAFGESRVLTLLPEDVRRVLLTLRLDAQNISLQASWEADTPESAARTAQGYGAMLAAARLHKRGLAEEAVYNNMTASASGKQLALRLEMSRASLGNILLRQITPN